jgi:hypothetical protein
MAISHRDRNIQMEREEDILVLHLSLGGKPGKVVAALQKIAKG